MLTRLGALEYPAKGTVLDSSRPEPFELARRAGKGDRKPLIMLHE